MLYNKIVEYQDELFADLNELMAIESVDGARDVDCAAALDFILKRAADFGLTSEKVTEKSAQVELGEGGRLCGVLSHLDVVPAGNNWSVDPFALTEKEGRLFGRGIADDKGAALVTLYCLRALKEMGVQGKNTLRAIYGTAEETGMTDMDGYFAERPLPDLAFTPDSEYGVCFAEKGILQLEISTPANEAKVLSQFRAGRAVNAVPDLAYVMLDSSGYDEQLLMRLADAGEGSFEFNYTIDGLMIVSRGRAAHACEPQKGYNAATALADLISHAYDVHEIGLLTSFIHYAINGETNGRSLGLKMNDVFYSKHRILIRKHVLLFPFQATGIDDTFAADAAAIVVGEIEQCCPGSCHGAFVTGVDNGVEGGVDDADKARPLLQAEVYATGGGTYARKLGGRGVAFGPNFKGDDIRMHNADESVDKENFLRHMQICFEAMYRLYTLE